MVGGKGFILGSDMAFFEVGFLVLERGVSVAWGREFWRRGWFFLFFSVWGSFIRCVLRWIV